MLVQLAVTSPSPKIARSKCAKEKGFFINIGQSPRTRDLKLLLEHLGLWAAVGALRPKPRQTSSLPVPTERSFALPHQDKPGEMVDVDDEISFIAYDDNGAAFRGSSTLTATRRMKPSKRKWRFIRRPQACSFDNQALAKPTLFVSASRKLPATSS